MSTSVDTIDFDLTTFLAFFSRIIRFKYLLASLASAAKKTCPPRAATLSENSVK